MRIVTAAPQSAKDCSWTLQLDCNRGGTSPDGVVYPPAPRGMLCADYLRHANDCCAGDANACRAIGVR